MPIEPGEKRVPRNVRRRRRRAQVPVVACRLEGGDEFPPEDLGERRNRKQKATLGHHPLPVGLQCPTGHQCMDMHMAPQVLLPGMQHQRESGRPTQPARVGRKLGERRRDRAEEHLVERPWTLPDESIQIVWQGEYKVEVRHRQHLALARGKPCLLGARLAQRAMAVAAGVIEVACRAAGVAGLHLATEGGGAAREDGAPDLGLGSRQGMGREISRAVTAQHLGQAHARDGANHVERSARGRVEQFQRRSGAGHTSARQMHVDQMCSCTFDLLDTESCYVQCRLQAFDCKGHQLETLNIILGAPVEAHD